MSEKKYTPGPWRYSSSDAYTHQVRSKNGALVGSFSQYSDGTPAADAKLAAAAPELLEALEALWREVQKYNIGHEGSELLEIMSDARAAIAKAKGRVNE